MHKVVTQVQKEKNKKSLIFKKCCESGAFLTKTSIGK